MSNLMLNEQIVIAQLDEIINILVNKVDDLLILTHFHFTGRTALFSKNDLTDLNLRLNSIKELEIFVRYACFMKTGCYHIMEDTIAEIVDQLPITYIQYVLIGKESHIRAYSSVENSKESLAKIVERYRENITERQS